MLESCVRLRCVNVGTRRRVDVSWTVEIVINVYSDMRAATAQRALSRRRRRLVRPCRASRQMPPGATITDTITYYIHYTPPPPRPPPRQRRARAERGVPPGYRGAPRGHVLRCESC